MRCCGMLTLKAGQRLLSQFRAPKQYFAFLRTGIFLYRGNGDGRAANNS